MLWKMPEDLCEVFRHFLLYSNKYVRNGKEQVKNLVIL